MACCDNPDTPYRAQHVALRQLRWVVYEASHPPHADVHASCIHVHGGWSTRHHILAVAPSTVALDVLLPRISMACSQVAPGGTRGLLRTSIVLWRVKAATAWHPELAYAWPSYWRSLPLTAAPCRRRVTVESSSHYTTPMAARGPPPATSCNVTTPYDITTPCNITTPLLCILLLPPCDPALTHGTMVHRVTPVSCGRMVPVKERAQRLFSALDQLRETEERDLGASLQVLRYVHPGSAQH